MELHREAEVPEGTCGYAELEKFQAFLGPQGYQLIVVEASRCIILFKDSKYNEAPNVIQLVKHQKHYDGLTSIPALMNRSYFSCHCQRAYDSEDARHHNCMSQNCPACGRTRKGTEPGCPNYAAWLTPEVECERCHIKFYRSDCFRAHRQKGKKKRGEKSLRTVMDNRKTG